MQSSKPASWFNWRSSIKPFHLLIGEGTESRASSISGQWSLLLTKSPNLCDNRSSEKILLNVLALAQALTGVPV